MIKITKEDASALRYSCGELPKKVLVGEYEITTETIHGEVRKADIFGRDFSSDYYDLILDENIKTVGRKHTFVKLAMIVVVLLAAVLCHGQVTRGTIPDSIMKKLLIPSENPYSLKSSIVDTVWYEEQRDTCLAIVVKSVPGSIVHTRVLIRLFIGVARRRKLFDLKGREVKDLIILGFHPLTDEDFIKFKITRKR